MAIKKIVGKQTKVEAAHPWPNFGAEPSGYPKLIKPLSGSDGYQFKSKAAGNLIVDSLIDDPEEYPKDAAIIEKYAKQFKSGNLLSDVPNIKLVVNGKEHHLTWAEAYNLGYALVRVANVCYFG